jgi:predicted ATP-grasp superfamily ATP-dependent carboligase
MVFQVVVATGTDLVAFLDSPDFPPISVVNNYVRFCAIDMAVQRDVAKAILKWTTKNECKLIISAQGIISSSSHHSRSRNGNKDFGNEDSNYDDKNNNDTAKSSTPTRLTTLPAVTSS